MAKPLAPLQPPKRGLPAMHPGVWFHEMVLPALKEAGTSAVAVEKMLGLSHASFYDVLRGRTPVSAELALKLGKLCGNGPDLWLNLQKAWDLEQARARLGETLDAIPTLKVA